MEDLKELVIQTLESSGQLGTLRAQLRSAVFKIIDGQESGRGVQWENPVAMKAMESATGQIACELFRDFLESFKMDYTLNVFLPECNLPNEKKNRQELCKKLGLSQEIQGPLLFALIDRGSNVGIEKLLSAPDKPSVVQIQPQVQQASQQQNIQQPGMQQKQPQTQTQQQNKQAEEQIAQQKQVQQQQQQASEKPKLNQQQQQQAEKPKQIQQQQQIAEKPKLGQQQQQVIEKPKQEPLPDIKGNKMGKLPPLNIQDDNEQERKRLAEIQSKIEEIEKKDKGNVLAEFRQEEEDEEDELEDQYDEEIEEDLEGDEEEEDIIKQNVGEAESSRKQGDSMGISSSMGMDPSVDSLELEKYDYVEKIQRVKQ